MMDGVAVLAEQREEAPEAAQWRTVTGRRWDQRSRLLVPLRVAEILETEQARRAAQEAAEDAALEPPALSPDPVPEYPDRPIVFSPEALALARSLWGKSRHDSAAQAEGWIKAMARDDGKRLLRPVPPRLDGLRERFPNFDKVIDHLEAQVALAEALGEAGRAMDPMLLVGPPGVGKTLFAEALAGALGVGLGICGVGCAQGGFDLVGTARHWSTATPGRVWWLLAEGEEANPVLLLDELDKITKGGLAPVEPALLDLLEPRCASRFEDQAVGVQFNAAAVWKICTANELDEVSAPLHSRLEVIEIPLPTPAQRERLIGRMWQDLVAGLVAAPVLAPGVRRGLAGGGLAPRELRRVLRSALGRALRDGLARIEDLPSPTAGLRRGPGFI